MKEYRHTEIQTMKTHRNTDRHKCTHTDRHTTNEAIQTDRIHTIKKDRTTDMHNEGIHNYTNTTNIKEDRTTERQALINTEIHKDITCRNTERQNDDE